MNKRNFVRDLAVVIIALVTLASILVYRVWIDNLPSLEIRVDGLQGQDTGELRLFAELP